MKLPEFPSIDLTNVDLPKFDLPKFDLPKFDLPKFDLPKFDPADVPAAARDAAYAAVGLGVITLEALRARRTELTALIAEWADKVSDTVTDDIIPQVQAVARTAQQQVRELLHLGAH
ncbi:MAG: hypothetical protein V9E89_16580 [Ilumatobacteraceae bacterium]